MSLLPAPPEVQVPVVIPPALTCKLPGYVGELTTFHNAFAAELRGAVEGLALPPNARVLDLACGDGFFSAAFAGRVPPVKEVVAADISSAFLELARNVGERADTVAPLAFVKADAYRLPFDDAGFDAVWCAQSFISLEDIPKALAEMQRVLKPGGLLAVFENDEFHHVIVNVPVALELRVQAALAAACFAESRDAARHSPARAGLKLLRDAGFRKMSKHSIAFDRVGPFDPFTMQFLERHFAKLRDQIVGYLAEHDLKQFDRLVEPGGFLADANSELICLNTLFTARR